MLPLRLVLDTNIIVSAALKPAGLQRTVLLLALTKPARLYVSPPVFAEYRAVLSRAELRIRKGLRQQLLQLLKNRAHFAAPSGSGSGTAARTRCTRRSLLVTVPSVSHHPAEPGKITSAISAVLV